MEKSQVATINAMKEGLLDSLGGLTTTLFISHLERHSVISAGERELLQTLTTTQDKLLRLLESLQYNDNGWSSIICFLRENNRNWLAEQLLRIEYINATSPVRVPTVPIETVEMAAFAHNLQKKLLDISPELHGFCNAAAQYYQIHYANLLSLWESPYHVKDAWVPLSVDSGRDFETEIRINHVQLVAQVRHSLGSNVALIKGDPGAGKTTLAKKIAYDWAINYGSAVNQFGLVLAVPLRSVSRFEDFVQMAIEYFLTKVNLGAILGYSEDDIRNVIGSIRGLGEYLLIIVDGLDEFGGYADSPFEKLFSKPFKTDAANSTFPPPILPFKLIITSRPYACNRINMEFFPLSYRILPLDKSNFGSFIEKYCRTENGKEKALAYASRYNRVIVEVPLILTFVCNLADQSSIEIPSDLPSLYDSFLYQMLRRAKRDGKLKEVIEEGKWRELLVAKSTAQLAFEARSDQYVFDKADMEKCGISEDSFSCGFLLYRYEFIHECLKAEFPHRSIEDFFTALHCYHLFLNDEGKNVVMERLLSKVSSATIKKTKPLFPTFPKEPTERANIVNMKNLSLCPNLRSDIAMSARGDISVSRFFVGICSKVSQFEKVIDWLQISFDNSQCLLYICEPKGSLRELDFAFSSNKSQSRHLGETISASFFGLEKFLANDWHRCKNAWYRGAPFELSECFVEGLQLKTLANEKGEVQIWYIADDKKHRAAKLLWAEKDVLSKLSETFDIINLFVWEYNSWHDFWRLVEQVDILNCISVRTIIMDADVGHSGFVCVAFHILYRDVPSRSLVNFRFGYDLWLHDEYLTHMNNWNMKDCTVSVESNVKDSKRHFYSYTVVVEEETLQSALIFTLIKLALNAIVP